MRYSRLRALPRDQGGDYGTREYLATWQHRSLGWQGVGICPPFHFGGTVTGTSVIVFYFFPPG